MAAVFNKLSDDEVKQSSQQEKKDVNRFLYAETVENDAAQEYNEIFIFFPRAGVEYHEQGKKYKNEFQAAEYQIYHPL